MLDKILKCFPEKEFIKADGFDDAIIGFDYNNGRLIYSVSKCIKILEKEMNRQDAEECFDCGVFNFYIGEKAPIWCYDNL